MPTALDDDPRARGEEVARAIGQELTKAWGATVVVDNGRGAGGAIGAEKVARAPADNALPALKPNQPNHSSAAPVTVRGRLCGGMGS